jgi:hypothetical protein
MRGKGVATIVLLAACGAAAQTPGPQQTPVENRREFRYSLAVIDDATILGGLRAPISGSNNRVLVEPAFRIRWQPHWSFTTSLIGAAQNSASPRAQVEVKEMFGGLSAGDFDFTAGRKIVRWGTGYAFSPAGVLDPPRSATDPTDRLNLYQGRDMLKADWVRAPHAMTLAWSTAALAPKSSGLRDTVAFRYNILVHSWDTALIAGNDRGGDSFGGLTFTRVLGSAWEIHGEALWREQAAVLVGGKYTTASGLDCIAEFYTPPNTAYYRSIAPVSPRAGRQHYGFLRIGKSRLRERPAWKEWDLAGSWVANLDDRSSTLIADINRRFGNRFVSYLHLEAPTGSATSQYGAVPYAASVSVGLGFHL